MVAQLSEYTKKHWIVNFEGANCMWYELSPNKAGSSRKAKRNFHSTVYTAKAMGSVPGQDSEITHNVLQGQKIKKLLKKNMRQRSSACLYIGAKSILEAEVWVK